MFKKILTGAATAALLGGAIVAAGAPAAHAGSTTGPSVCKASVDSATKDDLSKKLAAYVSELKAWDTENAKSRGGATNAPDIANTLYGFINTALSSGNYFDKSDIEDELKKNEKKPTIDSAYDNNSTLISAAKKRADALKVKPLSLAAAAGMYATVGSPSTAQATARINGISGELVSSWVALVLAQGKAVGNLYSNCMNYYGYSEDQIKSALQNYFNFMAMTDDFYWSYSKKDGFGITYATEEQAQALGSAMGSMASSVIPLTLSSLPFALSSGSSSK
ncbi:MAG: hypothetical protein Q3962_09495 [Corynebacterium sp.]|nr:hypothetical protein [Corynebacterium sp.]